MRPAYPDGLAAKIFPVLQAKCLRRHDVGAGGVVVRTDNADDLATVIRSDMVAIIRSILPCSRHMRFDDCTATSSKSTPIFAATSWPCRFPCRRYRRLCAEAPACGRPSRRQRSCRGHHLFQTSFLQPWPSADTAIGARATHLQVRKPKVSSSWVSPPLVEYGGLSPLDIFPGMPRGDSVFKIRLNAVSGLGNH